jgi:hypothetical protein
VFIVKLMGVPILEKAMAQLKKVLRRTLRKAIPGSNKPGMLVY